MAPSVRLALTLSVLLAGAVAARAQQPIQTDRPAEFVPLRPTTRADLDRREAQALYALGMLRQREDRLLDALRYLEDALQLDPQSAPIQRSLIPLYLALGRSDDVLKACRRALELDPADFETWYLYARQLREEGRSKRAIAALRRGAACPGIQERLDLLVQMHYDLAVLYEEARDFAGAEASFGEVVKTLVEKRDALEDMGPFSGEQLDAEAAKTYERLGRVCIQAKKYDRAIAAFAAAQKCDPDRAGRLNYNLAEVCLAQDKPGEALKYLDDYLRTQPPGSQAYELKISILKKQNRDQEILRSLRQYAERDPRNVPLQLLLARQYGEQQFWAEGERRYLKIAEETPTPEVYQGLFRLYREQAKAQGPRALSRVIDALDGAVAAAEPKDDAKVGDTAAAARARAMVSVLRDEPDLVKAMLGQSISELQDRRERSYATWRLLGALAARANQLDYAERLYRQCLQNITPQTEAEVYGGLLDVLGDAKKYEEVVKIARQGLRAAQVTNRILFQVKLAPALVQLGKDDEAVTAADEAVKVADDRNRLRIRRFRVAILTQVERYDRAVEECQAMLKEYSQPAEVRDIRYALSNVYSSARQFDKSEEQLRAILEIDPADATANNDLGYIMADQNKNLDESEQFVRKAIELDRAEKKSGGDVHAEGVDDNAAYLDSLGWVLFRRGKLAEAREWLEKAVALPGGEDAVVWDHLGDVCFKLEDTVKARSAWQKSLELYAKEKRRRSDDRSKEVKHKLELLEKE